MTDSSHRRLTLEELADANPAFPKWIMRFLKSGSKDKMRVANEGNSFRVFLTESEEKRMDAFLLEAGETPEWVQKYHKLQTRTFAPDVKTVMCIHCGCHQPKQTQCPNSDDFHF